MLRLRSVKTRPFRQEATTRLGRPVEFRSQFGEDALVWILCGRETTGTFIEAGAFDGYRFSATYALEAMGWHGLLVEANPGAAAECRVRRPRSRVVHAALGASPQGRVDFVVTDTDGMFSHVLGQAGRRKLPVRETVSVPVTTLDRLVDAAPIDALVLDVEGYELPVLEGFDLRRHGPKVLLVEDHPANVAVTRHMSALPYVELGWLRVNRIYVREDLAAAAAERLHGEMRSHPERFVEDL